jgi:hypothetical protein
LGARIVGDLADGEADRRELRLALSMRAIAEAAAKGAEALERDLAS